MQTSGLRQPTQIKLPGQVLAEVSESQSNARKPPSMIPSSIPTKRQLPNCECQTGRQLGMMWELTERIDSDREPEPKRKTLAERAGEPHGKSDAPATTKLPGRAPVKGQSLATIVSFSMYYLFVARPVMASDPRASPEIESFRDPVPMSQFRMRSSPRPLLTDRMRAFKGRLPTPFAVMEP